MLNTSKQNLPLVISCSGGSQSGNLADMIARRLQEKGLAHMESFSAMTGNYIKASLGTVAPRVIVIDGCHSACTKQSMALNGFGNCEYVDLIKSGIAKPGVAPTDAAVERGVQHIIQLLAQG